jgi:hypothetical protein
MISTHEPIERHETRRDGLFGIPGLVRQLRDDAAALVRQEVALAKAETRQNLSRLAGGAIGAVVGGLVLFTGAIVLIVAAYQGLARGLEAAGLSPVTTSWLAPLLVGAVIAVVGGVLLARGLRKARNATLVPHRTVDSVKETKEWIARKVS